MAVKKAKYQLCDMDIRRAFLERNKEFFKANIFANEFGINSTNIVDFASFDFKNNIFFLFAVKKFSITCRQQTNLKHFYPSKPEIATPIQLAYSPNGVTLVD